MVFHHNINRMQFRGWHSKLCVTQNPPIAVFIFIIANPGFIIANLDFIIANFIFIIANQHLP